MFKTHLRRSTRRPVFNKQVPQGDAVPAHVRTGRCVALVDARFLNWLMQGSDDCSGSNPVTPRDGVLATLAASLRQAGLEVDVARAYWYTDQTQGQPVDDVVQRCVVDPDTDGGVSLMRAMGGDLAQLAAHHAADHVLLVSDDERLLPAVDAAQLHGLGVHLLTDDSGNDFEKLLRDDPSWARLLAHADRRVLMQPMAPQPGSWSREVRVVDTPEGSEAQADIGQELQKWWAEEPEIQRLNLQSELQYSRGIPQEVDRQLLLRLSRALGHPLTWPEKKLMRAGVRDLALPATASEPAPAGDLG
jgi:hypothetical protein